MKPELEYLKDIGLTPIGVAGDAGPDERKARQLIVKEYPSILASECWSHQVCVRNFWWHLQNGIDFLAQDPITPH